MHLWSPGGDSALSDGVVSVLFSRHGPLHGLAMPSPGGKKGKGKDDKGKGKGKKGGIGGIPDATGYITIHCTSFRILIDIAR